MIKFIYLLVLLVITSSIKGAEGESVRNTTSESAEIILNNEKVEAFLDEFIKECESRSLNISEKLDALEFIIVESEGTDYSKLEKLELGKIVNGPGVLLSQNCLLDSMILRITLYRELCHFLGVSYIDEGPQIMSLKKPEGYSYGVFYDDIIKTVEYDTLFNQLKIALENKN